MSYKDGMEVGDDNMAKDWNHGLLKWWRTNESQRSEDDSQTHGNRGLLAIKVLPHLATH
jgi:hypothetical protein